MLFCNQAVSLFPSIIPSTLMFTSIVRCVYSNWSNQYLAVMPFLIPISYPVLHFVPNLIPLGIIYKWIGHIDQKSMVFRNRLMLWYMLSEGKTTSNSFLYFQMVCTIKIIINVVNLKCTFHLIISNYFRNAN